LNDEELELIGKLAAIQDLSFDPEKRVYEYSEIPGYDPECEWTYSIFERTRWCKVFDDYDDD
jgi:hypothetical protein